MAHGPARRRGRFRTSQGGKGAIKSTRRPQNTEQTAPAPPPSPTPAAVTAPKGPWAHHHRNRHRCRFRRRQRWSAAVRRSSAPASCARLLCAQTFSRRLAALESEAARCHHPHRHCRRQASRGLLPFPPSVASFASSPPAESANKPNPGAPVPPLVPSAKKARFRILLYTGPYYKAFYVPATSIGRSARLFLVIQKENFKKVSLSLCKTRKRKPTAI